MSNLRCFRTGQVEFRFPTEFRDDPAEVPNVTLLLGDNGGGKSTVLRAIAIATLLPWVRDSGLSMSYFVRRTSRGKQPATASIELEVAFQPLDSPRFASSKSSVARLQVDLERRRDTEQVSSVSTTLQSRTRAELQERMYMRNSPAAFVIGYGATRRIPNGGFRRSFGVDSDKRHFRYERIASLFEDDFALRGLEDWLPRARPRHREVYKLLRSVLPNHCRFVGAMKEGEYLFEMSGSPVPYRALSDGYRAFLAWVGDLISRLAEIAPPGQKLSMVPGVVLVDEVDLNLHPSWQLDVMSRLAQTFPKLQFIVTSHSPLLAASVQRGNVWLSESGRSRGVTLRRGDETLFGRTPDDVLLSPYFGLRQIRPASAVRELRELARHAARRDFAASLALLRKLTGAQGSAESLLREARTEVEVDSVPRKNRRKDR